MVPLIAAALILFPSALRALPPCADKIEAGERAYCPDSWLKIPRWVSYRATRENPYGIFAASGSALGEAVAQWVKTKGTLQVYEGPAFLSRDGVSTIKWTEAGAQPDTLWAFALAVGADGSLESLAVLAPAAAVMIAAPHITSIDAIEAVTGLDFLAEIPDNREGPLEAYRASALWGAPVIPAPNPPRPAPAAAPPSPSPPAAPAAVVVPKLPTQKPPEMSDRQWEAHKLWVEGGRKLEAGDMPGARDAYTRCVELDEARADCASAIMRTFGLK